MTSSCPRTTAALAGVDAMNDRADGVGFIPALIAAAAPIAAAAMGPKSSGPDYSRIAEIEARTAARELAALQASGRLDAASETRSKVLRYALIGAGILVALGAIGLFVSSRRKNPRTRSGARGRRRRRRRWNRWER